MDLAIQKEGERLLADDIPSSARETSLPEEVLGAFRTGRKIRTNPYLAWLYQQCLAAAELGRGAREKADGEGGERQEELLHNLFTGDRSKLSFLEKQTYAKWKSTMEFEKVKHPRRHRRKVVLIQPISWEKSCHMPSGKDNDDYEETEGVEVGYGHTQISTAVLGLLQQFCGAFYAGMEIRLSRSLDLSDIPKLASRIHRTTNRRQFLVDDIINFLHQHKMKKCYCILGVTVVDLYPGPKWNFVLGQASLEKGCGVFSFGRYFNSSAACVHAGIAVDVPLAMPPGGGCDRKAKRAESEQMKNIWVLMRVSVLSIVISICGVSRTARSKLDPSYNYSD